MSQPPEQQPPEQQPPDPARTRPWHSLIQPTLGFLVALGLLNAMLNVRYPHEEPPFWYLVPSSDVLLLCVYLAVLGKLKVAVPRWVHVGIVALLLLVRLLRVGDGVQQTYFAHRFTLYSDLPLIPEAVRFAWSTRSAVQFVLGGLLLLTALVGLAYACYRALRYAEQYLRDRRQVYVAAGIFAVFYVAVAVHTPEAGYEHLYAGGFADSAVPRVKREIDFLRSVYDQNEERARLIHSTQRLLSDIPHDLAKLGRADVYLILVESYGRTMFERPEHVTASHAAYAEFERVLGDSGFTIASRLLNSSTYGGGSWLAHATLNTAIPTRNQLEYEVLFAKKPKPLARFFRDAGYLTVLAQPGTTRDSPQGDFYAFQRKYYAWHYDYHGPTYGWATMPDQYILDFVRRREIEGKKQPLFLEYVLISSHAPWNALPGLVDDWSKIGNGEVFHDVTTRSWPIEWPQFDNATEAYNQAILYDFEILKRYITRFIQDGSLVIILGDHQPVAAVNGGSRERGVPIHVLSRNPELVRPFLSRGYVAGMRPRLSGPIPGLETFMPDFLVDFSTPKPLPQ
jgi:hypothetical protein